MELAHARILLTGASGGLGGALARALAWAGSELLLAGRDANKLEALRGQLNTRSAAVAADLNSDAGIAAVARAARDFDVNVLINNAGVGCFGLLDHQDWGEVERTLVTNLLTPVRLTQALLPWLKAQPQAAIVNVGSTFGSIHFAGFSAYSAAKAGLRGFSQSLRRELADSRVEVIHLAPRAIDTPLNSPAVNALNVALGNRGDSPEDAARGIVEALRRGDRERHIGFPESLFAWLNGIAPGLVDRGVAGKLSTIRKHATDS